MRIVSSSLAGIEPWSFEQHPGQAVFVPAGCPFQVRTLQVRAYEHVFYREIDVFQSKLPEFQMK